MRDIDAVYHLFRNIPGKESLPSDCTKRTDSITLAGGDMKKAQTDKE